MNYLSSEEIEKKRELGNLFDEWEPKVRELGKFIRDGFYPGYFLAQNRVLFLARESRGIGDQDDLIECFYPAYCSGCIGGVDKRGRRRKLSQSAFHRRLFKMAYCLVHGVDNPVEIPSISDLIQEFENGKLGFSYLNISKVTNFNTESYATDYGVLACFLMKSQEFLKREIDILSPNILVGSGIVGKDLLTETDLRKLGFVRRSCDRDNGVDVFHDEDAKRLLINFQRHFSALRGCDDQNTFLVPLVNVLRRTRFNR